MILIDDVTQRSLAENQLIQRVKMASMGELASSMAHDISTPLQAIIRDLNDLQTHIDNGGAESATDIENAILHAQQAAQIVSFIREVIRPVLSIACCDNGDDGFCQVSGLTLALILPGC